MPKQEFIKSIYNMSVEELRIFLAELEADEARILKLKEENPHTAELRSDNGLEHAEYSIFQSLSVLSPLQERISVIKKLIEENS